jgi:lipoprotein-anchoring transpeptidase ErfK/SrfK
MSNLRQNLRMRTWTLAVLLAAMVAGDCAAAQTNQRQNDQQVSPMSQVQGTTAKNRLIVVSIPDRKLVLMENGAVKRVYPVAVGKPSTPSPAGQFTIVRRVSDPTYSHHGKVVAPGPKNPVGSRWMGLSAKGYGIHGTNEPNSIGKAASHGCIRMGKADLEELYALVGTGDAVEIHADHDATVAMALGEVAPAPSAEPVTVTAANQVLLADTAGSVAPRAGQ